MFAELLKGRPSRMNLRRNHQRFFVTMLMGSLMFTLACTVVASSSRGAPFMQPAELKDWQKSLPLFIKHVESVRTSPTDSRKVSMLEGDSRVLQFAMMASVGGCAGKAPDAVFGPRVQFTGNFQKISPASENERIQHGVQNSLSISFEKTSPGSVLYVFPMTSDTASWRKLSANSEVRFEAELNCIVGLQLPNGQVAYSLTLKKAKVLP